MRAALLLVVMLFAAACTAPAPEGPFIGIDGKPLVSAEGIVDSSVQEALAADPAACAKAGGALTPVCRMQKPMCLITFSDAGKTCSDGADCASGRCLAEGNPGPQKPATGQCAATNDPCGCYTRIEDGAAQAAICVD